MVLMWTIASLQSVLNAAESPKAQFQAGKRSSRASVAVISRGLGAEGAYPEGAYSEGAYLEGAYPEGAYPEDAYPEGQGRQRAAALAQSKEPEHLLHPDLRLAAAALAGLLVITGA